MLVQATTPRPIFDHSKHPSYLHIHTLRKRGVSTGEVFFAGPTDPEHGHHGTVVIDPLRVFPIDGEDGFEALEHIIPFWRVFQRDRPIMYDGTGAADGSGRMTIESQGIRAGSIKLTRYCTAGFGVTAKSAFRANPHRYEEHTVAFRIIMPVTGGGILRLADCPFDMSNPTFDPYAPDPVRQLTDGKARPDLEMQAAYNHAHRLGGSSDHRDRIRAGRIASLESGTAISFEDTPQNRGLPPGVTRKKLRS